MQNFITKLENYSTKFENYSNKFENYSNKIENYYHKIKKITTDLISYSNKQYIRNNVKYVPIINTQFAFTIGTKGKLGAFNKHPKLESISFTNTTKIELEKMNYRFVEHVGPVVTKDSNVRVFPYEDVVAELENQQDFEKVIFTKYTTPYISHEYKVDPELCIAIANFIKKKDANNCCFNNNY